nr:hypothetical protein [Tanacetum cinerariifolium]
MANDAATPSIGVSRSKPSSSHAPLFRDVFGDAIHVDFFPFYYGPYYATYPEGGIAETCEFTHEEWDAPYWPTFRFMTKEVFKDPAISVLHCKMMSHSGELLPRYHGLNQSHHEYVLSADSRLKGYEEKVASLTGLELQVYTLKKQVSRLNEKLCSSDASFAKSKAKGKEKKKKIKSLTKSSDNLHVEVARLYADLNRATVLEAEKDEEILRLKATPLDAGFEHGLSMHQTKDEFANVLKKMANFMPDAQDRLAKASLLLLKLIMPLDARVSLPIAKESTMTPASKSLELSTNVAPAPFAYALEKNEEWVNAMVDGPNVEMTDGAAHSKSGGVFVQGTSHVLDDIAEVIVVGSKRVSLGLTDVVVALSAGEKGDAFLPSSTVDEEVAANPYEI